LIVVVAQLAVLAYMGAEREWLLRTGKTVLIRTAPIDPQDPMRGDYVRFNYDIATVPKKLCRDDVLTWFGAQNFSYPRTQLDRRVYATIKLDRSGVAELVSLSDRVPTEGMFLRARVESVSTSAVRIRFGVEAFFMQQGKAREFENLVRGEKQGVPLNIEVAVNSRGLATIRGYRWEPLGITLTLDRAPTPSNPSPQIPRPGLRGVTVQLKNHSDQPVAILASDEARFLRMIPARELMDGENSHAWEWTQAAVTPPEPRPDEIKLLQPGETHRIHLDFASPQWFVRKGADGAPTSLTSLTQEWSASFRIEYVPPSEESCARLPHAEQIRHARLRSRMFSAAGGVD
jgi:uncharacterized membrane-anchored protein